MVRLIVLALLLTACKTVAGSHVVATTEVSQSETLDLTKYIASEADYQQFRNELGADYDRELLQLEGYLKDGNRKIPDAHAKLAQPEKLAIYHYSSMGYRNLNKVLRKSDLNATSQLAGFIKVLSSALNKLPAFKGTVHRGGLLPAFGNGDYFSPFHTIKSVDPDRLAAFSPGQIFVDKGFMSTSLHDADGIRQAFGCREALYTIKSNFGRDISPLVLIPEEQEILFVPGSEFKIVKIQNTFPPENKCTNEVVELDVEEVEPGTYKPAS